MRENNPLLHQVTDVASSHGIYIVALVISKLRENLTDFVEFSLDIQPSVPTLDIYI